MSRATLSRVVRSPLALVAVAPAVFLLVLVTHPIPNKISPRRHVAGYFQALSYWRDGFGALFYNTPSENLSSLHLHSLLSAPLVGLGYTEAGRFVSLVAAVVAVLLLGRLATTLFDRRVGILATLALWLHPLFIWWSVSFVPEALSIAATLAVVTATVRAVESPSSKWFACVLGLLVVAPTVHLWEATVALVPVALFASERRWREAGATAAVTVLTVGSIYLVTHLQPTGGSTLLGYAAFSDGNWLLYADPNWLVPALGPFDFGTPAAAYGFEPTRAVSQLTTLVAGGAFLSAAARTVRTGERRWVLLSAWLASGLSIPLLLPKGYLIHMYYSWALVAPTVLVLSSVLTPVLVSVSETLGDGLPTPVDAGRVRAGGVGLFLLAVLLVVVVTTPWTVAVGATAQPPIQDTEADISDGAFAAAETIRTEQAPLRSLWFESTETPPATYGGSEVARTLVYSGLLPKERRITDPQPPHYGTPPTDCPVLHEEPGFVVYRCR